MSPLAEKCELPNVGRRLESGLFVAHAPEISSVSVGVTKILTKRLKKNSYNLTIAVISICFCIWSISLDWKALIELRLDWAAFDGVDWIEHCSFMARRFPTKYLLSNYDYLISSIKAPKQNDSLKITFNKRYITEGIPLWYKFQMFTITDSRMQHTIWITEQTHLMPTNR